MVFIYLQCNSEHTSSSAMKHTKQSIGSVFQTATYVHACWENANHSLLQEAIDE